MICFGPACAAFETLKRAIGFGRPCSFVRPLFAHQFCQWPCHLGVVGHIQTEDTAELLVVGTFRPLIAANFPESGACCSHPMICPTYHIEPRATSHFCTFSLRLAHPRASNTLCRCRRCSSIVPLNTATSSILCTCVLQVWPQEVVYHPLERLSGVL